MEGEGEREALSMSMFMFMFMYVRYLTSSTPILYDVIWGSCRSVLPIIYYHLLVVACRLLCTVLVWSRYSC